MRTVQRRKVCTVLLSWSLCCCIGRGSSRGWCWVAEEGGEAAGDDATAGEVAADEAAARCRASRSSLSCNSSKLGLAAVVGAMPCELGGGVAAAAAVCGGVPPSCWTRFTARQSSGCPSTSCTHPLRVLRTMCVTPRLLPPRDSLVMALNPDVLKLSSSSWLSSSLYGSYRANSSPPLSHSQTPATMLVRLVADLKRGESGESGEIRAYVFRVGHTTRELARTYYRNTTEPGPFILHPGYRGV